MMQYVAPCAAKLGYQPDYRHPKSLTADSLGYAAGMHTVILSAARSGQGVDTAVDMREGVNAGAWSVGVLEGSVCWG